MDESALFTIPARSGKAVLVDAGQRVKVINTLGQQVVDTWAFNRESLAESMSMEHTRSSLSRIMVRTGESLVTKMRRPILTVVEDTSPGIHDTLMSACDKFRYELLGCEGYHNNCTDNLATAMAELGLAPSETPSPWNLFMNVSISADGGLSIVPPPCKVGDYILLQAEMDCVVAFSACPQDMVPTNGLACIPTEAHFQLL